jgi:hypothetical protein
LYGKRIGALPSLRPRVFTDLPAASTGAGNRDSAGRPNILQALIFEGDGATDEAIQVLSFDFATLIGVVCEIARKLGVRTPFVDALFGLARLHVWG